MERFRIYIDTSVLGGCFDPEFASWSNGLMRDFRAGRHVPVLSDVTAAEVASAPASVRELHQEMLGLAGVVLPMTSAVLTLVTQYEARKILGAKFRADMQHIVRLEKIRLFNAVNVESGYRVLSIRSPREVTTYEGH